MLSLIFSLILSIMAGFRYSLPAALRHCRLFRSLRYYCIRHFRQSLFFHFRRRFSADISPLDTLSHAADRLYLLSFRLTLAISLFIFISSAIAADIWLIIDTYFRRYAFFTPLIDTFAAITLPAITPLADYHATILISLARRC
jgi:hypothetical protein